MEHTPQLVVTNAFGVKLVLLDTERNLRILLNDGSRHGSQSVDPGRGDEPLDYYHRSGPLGEVFTAFAGADGAGRAAIIGLGVGAMAAYAQPGQHFTFYEIDPAVADVARDTRYFTFLSRCCGTHEVVIGDGRLMLSKAPDRHYDMIVLDAFNADVIPEHLVSPEALDGYLQKLTDGGILVFHISNVYVELAPILGAMAAEADLVCLSRFDREVSDQERAMGKLPSHYAVIARGLADVRPLVDNPAWKTV
ncbi:MAG TPA: fused MFS/spermidine synthase [Phycisphaerae bacterium]|nr:fused MFS/spermidine synthase [Phycisphaerae bacterium]